MYYVSMYVCTMYIFHIRAGLCWFVFCSFFRYIVIFIHVYTFCLHWYKVILCILTLEMIASVHWKSLHVLFLDGTTPWRARPFEVHPGQSSSWPWFEHVAPTEKAVRLARTWFQWFQWKFHLKFEIWVFLVSTIF